MPQPNPSINQMVATTISNYIPELTDNVFNGIPTYKWLVNTKGKKSREQGGNTIIQPIEFASNTNVRWMGEYDQYAFNPQNFITAVEAAWKSISGTIVVTHLEDVKNSGKYAVIKLTKAKFANLTKSLQNDMDRVFFSDGTVTNEPVGLQAICQTTGTYLGINRATAGNEFWQSNVNSTTEAFSIAALRDMVNLASHNVSKPDGIVTTRTLYGIYESKVQAYYNITQTNDGALGFDHLSYRGIPLWWDDYCPSGMMFVLNSEYLTVYCHADYEWKQGDPINPTQPLTIYPVEWFGNIICSGPRYLGVLQNKS